MPDIKEKLFTLIGQVQDEGKDYSDCFVKGDKPISIENHDLVDYLISNGVTIQKTGRWVKRHRHCGGFRRYTGYDEFGEKHTITVDERCEYDDLYCSECGRQSADNFLSFCPNCGAMMEGEYS